MMLKMIESGSFPSGTEPGPSVKDDSTVTDNEDKVKEKHEHYINAAPANRRMSKATLKNKSKVSVVKK